MIEARDPRRREFGTITVALRQGGGRARRADPRRAGTRVDAQNNRTTVRLSGQRFNVPVADSAFPIGDPTARAAR